MNIMTFSLPESPSFVIINVGDASVINIQNPGIHAVGSKRNLMGIGQDMLDDEVKVKLVLSTRHVVLKVVVAVVWNNPPWTRIVCFNR